MFKLYLRVWKVTFAVNRILTFCQNCSYEKLAISFRQFHSLWSSKSFGCYLDHFHFYVCLLGTIENVQSKLQNVTMNCKIPNRQSKTRTEHCRNLQFFSFPLMLIDERGCENSVCVPLILPNVRPHNLSYQHWLISFLFMSLLLVFSHFLFFEKKKKKKTISLLFNQNRKQNNYPLSSSDLLFAWNFYTFFLFPANRSEIS